jgi:hypothetical protein
MKSITHTQDSLKLIEFLKDYPDQWHSVRKDKRTSRAVVRVRTLYPENIEQACYVGQSTDQIRFNSIKAVA